MYRDDFDDLFEHFSETLGSEDLDDLYDKDGFITIFEQKASGVCGCDGYQLVEKCKIQKGEAIVLTNRGSSIMTETGRQVQFINLSFRIARDDLNGCYFFRNKTRYKFILKQNMEGRVNNKYWYHYDCYQG
jgi:hypothetical protein